MKVCHADNCTEEATHAVLYEDSERHAHFMRVCEVHRKALRNCLIAWWALPELKREFDAGNVWIKM